MNPILLLEASLSLTRNSLERPLSLLRHATRFVLLSWVAAACVAWTPRRFDRNSIVVTELPGEVRLVLRNGKRVDLRDARLTRDSVSGVSPGDVSRIPVSVATDSVRTIQRRRVSPAHTIALMGGLGVVAIAGFLIAFAAGTGPGY